MSSKQRTTKSYAGIEFFVVTSICFMPYTALKFIGPVGPSELLILMSAIAVIIKNRGRIQHPKRLSYFTTTLRSYIALCLVGFCWNSVTLFLTGNLSSSINSIAFDFFSYCFNLLSLYTLEFLLNNKEIEMDAEEVLRKVVDINCIVMPTLFIISMFRSSILGLPLRHYRYFAPFANNIHHTSMYLLPLIFLSLFFAAKESSIVKKLLFSAAAVVFSSFAIQTGALKALLGVIAGSIVSAFYLLTTKKGNMNKTTTLLITLSIVVCFMVIYLNYDTVSQYAIHYFIDNDGGGARSIIWKSALEKWTESPVFGFGPGAHVIGAYGTTYDAHNTFISTMLQTGLAGLVVYLKMWIQTIRKSIKNGYILAMFMAILVYSTGGDTLRRIPIWVFSILAYYTLEKVRSK